MSNFEPSGIKNANVVGVAVADAGPAPYNDNVTQVRIAVDHGYKDKTTGEWKKTSTTFINYTTVGDYATTSKQVKKGDRIKLEDVSIETSEYKPTKGDHAGETRLGVEAHYGQLVIIEAAVDRPAKSSDGFTPAKSDDPWAV